MARNVEIKARINNYTEVMARAAAVADSGPTEICQDDTFFSCSNGRMKLRSFSATEGELIFYRRSDIAAPKESFYVIAPTAAPELLREVLSAAYGQAGRVCKTRTLFMAGRTRIHLDRVKGLGDYLELEVLLAEDEPAEAGVAIANGLLKELGVSPEQLVDRAYVDLIALKSRPEQEGGT
jgi:predicted adenylyl cyclase CyaB